MKRIRLRVVAAGLAWLLAGWTAASAAQWTGEAGDGLWSTPGNWVNDTLPGEGSTVTFGDSATNGPHTVIVDGAYTDLAQIVFSGSGDRQFTLTAADEDAVLAMSNARGIDMTAAQARDVEIAVRFGTTQTDAWLLRNSSAQRLTISGPMTYRVGSDTASSMRLEGGRFAFNHPQAANLTFRNRMHLECDELVFLEGYGENTTFPLTLRLTQYYTTPATILFTRSAIFEGGWSVYKDMSAYVGLTNAGPADVTLNVQGRAEVRLAGWEADWPDAVLRFLDNDENSQGRLIFNLSGNHNHYMPADTRSNTVMQFSSSGAAEMTFHDTGDNYRPSMAIAGEGSLWKSGAGTLTVRSDNSYSGRTMLSGGTLKLDTFTYNDNTYEGQLPAATIVEIGEGATFDLNGIDQTVGGLTDWTGLDQTNAPTAGGVMLGGAKLTVNAAQASSFGGQVAGTGTLVKAGAESFTLTAGYTNAAGRVLRVEEGLLAVSGALAIEEGAFELAGGFVQAGSLSATGMLWNVTLDAGYEGKEIVSAGSADITGATLALALAGAYAPAIDTEFTLLTIPAGTIGGGDLFGHAEDDIINVNGTPFRINRVPGSENIVLTVIPEPGALALLMLAAGLLLARRRRGIRPRST